MAEPDDELRVAALTGFKIKFFCHGKPMEVLSDDAGSFKLTCDLCGKGPTGQIGPNDPEDDDP